MNQEKKIESLEEFRHRTEGFSRDSLPWQGEFWTNPNLTGKVDGQGGMKEYCGNTVVFLLDEECIDRLRHIQEVL